VGAEGGRLGEGVEAVHRLRHPVAVEAEELGVHLAIVLEVVHHEDERAGLLARGRAARLPLRHHRLRSRTGRVRVKVEPWPATLCSSTRPSIMTARRRQMARPRPAPPYSRAGELSAWRKSSNTRSWSSLLMPMPVSVTATATSLSAGQYCADTT